MRLVLTALIPVMMACSAPASQAQSVDSVAPRTISVTGVGRAAAAPDLAVLTFGVQAQGQTAGAALNANAKQMNAVTQTLRARGIAGRDIQTSNFSLNPTYARDERGRTNTNKIVGYQTVNTLTVRVRDVDEVGETIDAVVSAGVNRFNGVRFAFQDPADLQDDARRNAVKNGKAIAALLAGEAGAKLGPVLTITAHSSNPTPRPMARMMVAEDAVSSTPIEAGESELSVSVNMVFELK